MKGWKHFEEVYFENSGKVLGQKQITGLVAKFEAKYVYTYFYVAWAKKKYCCMTCNFSNENKEFWSND